MKDVPVTVSFHNVGSSPAMEATALKRVAALQTRYGRILGCHVLIDKPYRRRRTDRRCRVRVGLAMPGELIVVDRMPRAGRAMKGLDGAFELIDRRLRTIRRGSTRSATRRP